MNGTLKRGLGWLRRNLPQGHPISFESWRRRHNGIVIVLWAHVVGVPIYGIIRGLGVVHSLLEASIIGALALCASTAGLSRSMRTVFATLGLMTSSAILTHFSGGLIEMHFHFFVMVAVVTLYQSWLPFGLAVGFVVLHHGLIGSLDPSGVFNHPDAIAHPWTWAVVHGVFILAESIACLVAWRMNEVSLESERGARLELQRANTELAEAQEIARIGSWEWDLKTNEVCWSEQLYRIFGLPAEYKPTYRSFLELVYPSDLARVEGVVGKSVSEKIPLQYECRVVRPDGSLRTIHALGETTSDADGTPVRVIGTCQDITERKALEQEVEHQAFHDALTGLANRALFLNRVEHALALRDRNGMALSILFIDLDGFKAVNDTQGHAAGDELLRETARRLTGSLRPTDTVARIGGDEFAVLLEGSDAGSAQVVADRIQTANERTLLLGDHALVIRSSIGIAAAEGQVSAEDLLRDADIAMYSVKNKREEGTTSALFVPGMRDSIVQRLEMKDELAHAIEHSELILHFQPIVDLPTQEIRGLEALVRWQHPTKGLVPPGDFISLAEETGQIVPLGEWVLKEATRRGKELQDALGRRIYMTVNLSARQLHQVGLVASVSKALLESKLDPSDLVLEITESSLMEDAAYGKKILGELRELGLRVAIDDFGTGYSSLSYLRQFPLDILKIDRSFISNIAGGPEESAVAEALIHLSRILDLETVAEGIETSAQLKELLDLGCPSAQGYLFARPLPLEEIRVHLLVSEKGPQAAHV
jgi:diguanylate cyclase (GGDEF)-like protein/PAS domain S-box-containing protein